MDIDLPYHEIFLNNNDDAPVIAVTDNHTMYMFCEKLTENDIRHYLQAAAKSQDYSPECIIRVIENKKHDHGNFGYVWVKDSRFFAALTGNEDDEISETSSSPGDGSVSDVLNDPNVSFRILGDSSPRKSKLPVPPEGLVLQPYSWDLERVTGCYYEEIFVQRRPSWITDQMILDVARTFITEEISEIASDAPGGYPITVRYPYISRLGKNSARGTIPDSVIHFSPNTYDALFAQLFLFRYTFVHPKRPTVTHQLTAQMRKIPRRR